MSTFTFSCRIPGCKHRYYNPLHAMQCKRARLPGSACTQGTHLKTMPCQYTCRWRVTKTTACLTTKVSSPYMCCTALMRHVPTYRFKATHARHMDNIARVTYMVIQQQPSDRPAILPKLHAMKLTSHVVHAITTMPLS